MYYRTASMCQSLTGLYVGLILAMICFAMLLAGEAIAQNAPSSVDHRKDGLYVEADILDVDRKALIAKFTGEVKIRQADRDIHADRVEVYYIEKDGTMKPTIIRAFGKVYFSGDGLVARDADTGVFDVRAQTLKLRGTVTLTQGDNVIEGDEVDVNLRTGLASVKGGASQQRVRGEFVLENIE